MLITGVELPISFSSQIESDLLGSSHEIKKIMKDIMIFRIFQEYPHLAMPILKRLTLSNTPKGVNA